MKRKWSNNGGFTALRMLEESSSEVTSSSNGLVITSSGMTMSPTSLDSPDYGDQDLWLYNESAYNPHQHSVITSVHGCTTLPPQTTIIPLPSIQTNNLNHHINHQNNNNSNNNYNNSNSIHQNGHLNGHNGHHHMQHTPRSDSANSISSGEFLLFNSEFNQYHLL